jgi:hypothetical protein
MKKRVIHWAGVTALLAALLTAGFSGCTMDSGTPAEGEGSAEAVLVKEAGKYVTAFVLDEDDIGKDITSRVIELKEGERADRSVQVSVAKVDGSGYFSLEKGALKLAALPPKPAEQGEVGGGTGEEIRELYKIFPGAGEVTLEFKKGDKVLPLNIMIRIVEPGTEGSRIAVNFNGPAGTMLYGYDKINELYIADTNSWGRILDPSMVIVCNMIEVVKKPDSSGEEVQLDCYFRDAITGVKDLDWINYYRIAAVVQLYFSLAARYSAADEILKTYGTHILRRADISADGKFSHLNDGDLIPIWEFVPYTDFLLTDRDREAGRQKAAEIKEEYERQMALKNQP